MGIRFSKGRASGRGSKGRASGRGTSASVSAGGNMECMAELSTYEAACEVDPEIQTIDAGLQQRTSRFISDLFVNVQLPFASLNEAAGSPFDMNQNDVRIILESKKDKWKNFKMFQLVDDYFKSCIRMSDFFTALDTSLKKASDSQPIVELAIKSFDKEYAVAVAVAADEENQPPEVKRETRYVKTLDELREYLFIEGIGEFKSVYQQQLSMLGKLENRKVEQNRKLNSVKIWRKFTCIIFLSIVAVLHICFVVDAIVAAPHIAAALAAASAIPLVSMGKWFDSMWKEYQDALKAENELINTMHAGTSVVLTDLNGIGILVNRLEDNIRWLLYDAEFVFKEEDAARISIDEMREKMLVFMKDIKVLVQQVDQCCRVIRTARTLILQRIIELSK